jgi:hypothetical protein
LERSIEPVDALRRSQPGRLIRLAQESLRFLLIHWLGGKLRADTLGGKAPGFRLLRSCQILLAWLQPQGRVQPAVWMRVGEHTRSLS